MKTSIPRLGAIRFKDGPTVRVIRNRKMEDCVEAFKDEVADIVEQRNGDMVGFAIVAWGIDGCCTAVRTFTGPISPLMVPDFAKTAISDYVTNPAPPAKPRIP